MKPGIMIAALLCGAALSGCVQNYADREVTQGAAPATMTISNAPEGATVLVDGRAVGVVGRNQAGFPITVGRHDVVIKVGDRSLHSQTVFVSAGARVEVRVQ